MFDPQMTSSQMELLPLVCLCLLSWSGTTSADQPETVKVDEGSDAILPCFIKGSNIETAAFDWKKENKEVFSFDAGRHYNNGRTGQAEQFKGRVSHFQDELKHGNASIKITNVKMADSGDYTCEFPNLQSSPTFHIKLVVGAASKPSVNIRKAENGVLLLCDVQATSPNLKVEWKDSSGNIVPAEEPQVTERGNSYDIILRAPVTKTDNYRCVVTQEEINHQIDTEIYVPLNGNTGWIVAVIVLSIVLLAVVVGVVLYRRKLKRNKDKKKPEEKLMNQTEEIPPDQPNSEKKPDENPNESAKLRESM